MYPRSVKHQTTLTDYDSRYGLTTTETPETPSALTWEEILGHTVYD